VSYITAEAVRSAVAPDNNILGTAAELDTDQLNSAIGEAADKVNSYAGAAFTDDNVPGLVKALTLALAAYYATLTYRKGKPLDQFDPVYLRYQDAVQTMKDLRSGLIELTPPIETGTPTSPGRPTVFNPQTATMFTLEDAGLGVSVGRRGRLISEVDRGDFEA
jgi:phage gp36-like protein